MNNYNEGPVFKPEDSKEALNYYNIHGRFDWDKFE